MAHCDSCRCRNGNFNEVGAAVVVSSPLTVWENDTLSTLPKNGPVISLEIDAKTPVSLYINKPNTLCAHTYHCKGEVNKEVVDPVHSYSAQPLLFHCFALSDCGVFTPTLVACLHRGMKDHPTFCSLVKEQSLFVPSKMLSRIQYTNTQRQIF